MRKLKIKPSRLVFKILKLNQPFLFIFENLTNMISLNWFVGFFGFAYTLSFMWLMPFHPTFVTFNLKSLFGLYISAIFYYTCCIISLMVIKMIFPIQKWLWPQWCQNYFFLSHDHSFIYIHVYVYKIWYTLVSGNDIEPVKQN